MKHTLFHIIKYKILGLLLSIIPLISVYAEVVMDGTLGQQINVTGPDYQIQSDYGKQAGTNLFHSFEQFNINTNESANFIVPGDIENIIGRVTGGNPSHIEGIIRSTLEGTNIISSANLFLLNPLGIMFSENASLEIGGSFHVSTADYLRLGSNDIFYAIPLESDILSVSSPQAFGFLNDDIGDITFEGKGEIAAEDYIGSLHVNSNQNISVIGGNIGISKGTFYYDSYYQAYNFIGNLTAPEGNINLAAIASAGEVLLKNNVLDISMIEKLGNVSISDFSLIDVSGEGGGNVFIRAEQIDINDSSIAGEIYGFRNGGVIDISANKIFIKKSQIGIITTSSGSAGDIIINANDTLELNEGMIFNISETFGNCGNISIDAKNLLLNNGSQIVNSTGLFGNAGNITIQNCENLSISGHDFYGQASLIHSLSGIENDNESYGNGYGDTGNITIKNTTKISIKDGGQIATVTYTTGHAGTVSIMDSDQIVLSGVDQEGYPSTILSDTRNTNSDHAGNAGDIYIQTKAFILNDGAKISSSSAGTGNGGNIRIEASDAITMAGCDYNSGQGSTIFTDSRRQTNGGQAGKIEMITNSLTLNDGAQISSSSLGMGRSGSIYIKASEQIKLSGKDQSKEGKQASTIFAITTNQAETDENSGLITLQTKHLFLTDNAIVSTTSKGIADAGHIVAEVDTAALYNANIYSSSTQALGGDAGTISIHANHSIQLMGTSVISTEALNAGGGTISLLSDHFIYLMDSEITSSVDTGIDSGGDIFVSTPLAAMNHSDIYATAYDGKGGTVHINADYFIKSADSIIDVQSLSGIDGSVIIDSADIDLNKELGDFSPNFLNAEKWMQTPCYSRRGNHLSRFILSKPEGLPVALDDFLPCPLIMPVKKNSSINAKEYDLCITAMQHYQKGDFIHAIQTWEKAITFLEPDQRLYQETMICLADAYKLMGFQKKTLSILNSNLSFVNHDLLKALLYNYKGDIYLLKGDTQTAKQYFDKSSQYALLSQSTIVYAGVLNNMANYYVATGDLSQALKLYTLSLKKIDTCEQDNTTKTEQSSIESLGSQLKSRLLINIARLNMLADNRETSVNALKRSLLQIKQLKDSHDKLVDLISLSILAQKIIKKYQLIEHQLLEIASQSLNNAILIAENINNLRMLSCANGYLGQLYELRQDNEKAKTQTRKALFLAQEKGYAEIVYRWQWQLGRLFASGNRIEKAISLYANAIETLSSVRTQLYNGFRHKIDMFTDRIRPLYLERTDLLLKQARQVNSRKKEKLIQARDTMELLKQAEIVDFYQDECLEKQQSSTIPMDTIPEQTALIYPISMPDRLVLLLALGETIQQIDIPVTAYQLHTTARQLFLRLQSKSNDLFKRQSRKLYKWLIAPVQPELQAHHVKIVVIVPDVVLRLIPFSALLGGNQFLIEQYALVTIPALSLTEYESLAKPNHRILINGLSSASQGYPALTNVVKEIGYVQSIMKQNTLLHDKTYTLKNLTEQFSHYSFTMLHLATHGHFGSKPEDTFLLTYDGKMTMNTLEHLIKTNRFHNPHVELLTLSACTTAMGDERAALGMAGAAIKAGVKSVIATLWQIDDEISSEIVKNIYHGYIQSDMSKAIALQNAQKQCIKNKKYSHPAYWAPFMLIGNWM